MSAGETRFRKGESGNPRGRPKARRPHVSAFDIIFDKTLTVNQGGTVRELTVDEGLQLQTYQAALKGSRMAVRAVLKMIEKRERALAAKSPKRVSPVAMQIEHDADNADKALLLLGIAQYPDPPEGWGSERMHLKLATWATQAAISRPGRRKFADKDIDDVKRMTIDPGKLKWPKERRG